MRNGLSDGWPFTLHGNTCGWGNGVALEELQLGSGAISGIINECGRYTALKKAAKSI
jgi:hypothetical protein